MANFNSNSNLLQLRRKLQSAYRESQLLVGRLILLRILDVISKPLTNTLLYVFPKQCFWETQYLLTDLYYL